MQPTIHPPPFMPPLHLSDVFIGTALDVVDEVIVAVVVVAVEAAVVVVVAAVTVVAAATVVVVAAVAVAYHWRLY